MSVGVDVGISSSEYGNSAEKAWVAVMLAGCVLGGLLSLDIILPSEIPKMPISESEGG